jgi:hypothetical protein
VYIDITVQNSRAMASTFSAAFSWQDVISRNQWYSDIQEPMVSRNIFDATDEEVDKYYPNTTDSADPGSETMGPSPVRWM